ncbi:MAG: hypothetical protein PVI39_12900 [Desulfobacteraceae bacterium]|jgi:hypothetical protein
MKNTVLLLLFIGLILGSAIEALACGACMYIHFDRILPPIMGWVALSVMWSFSLSIYSAITGTKIRGVCRPVSWLILFLILFFTSFMFIGPIFLLILIFPGIISAINELLPDKSVNSEVKRGLRIISAAGIAGLLILITMTVNIKHERTEADFILKNENSWPAKMALNRLIEQTPAQLNDLREIALKGKNTRTVAIASEGIATHGDPFQDVPLLLNVYEKNFGNDDDEKIESALSKLTGLTLPEGSPPAEWTRNWNLRADEDHTMAKIAIEPRE